MGVKEAIKIGGIASFSYCRVNFKKGNCCRIVFGVGGRGVTVAVIGAIRPQTSENKAARVPLTKMIYFSMFFSTLLFNLVSTVG